MMGKTIFRFLVIISLSIIVPLDAYAFNVYIVGSPVKGKTYNNLLSRWIDMEIKLLVGRDGGKEYIIFQSNTGASTASALIPYSKNVNTKLVGILEKSIEWSAIALKNKADTTKTMGCFNGIGFEKICESPYNKASFTFFAQNNGSTSDLIISLVDQNNQFINAEIYLPPASVANFLVNARNIENEMKKAREQNSKENLFK